MDDSGGPATRGARAAPRSTAVFVALVFDGARWMRIGGPHPDARAACMSVATWVNLMDPGLPIAALRERAEDAVRSLDSGAPSAPVINERHRVDRVG